MSVDSQSNAGSSAHDQVLATVRTLLARLIDYAGLFPPAALDMTTTVQHYARYAEHDDAWMLGRLIVPVTRLAEFESAANRLLPTDVDAEPWHLSCLLAAAGTDELPDQIDVLLEFNERHSDSASGLAVVDVVELRADKTVAIDTALNLMPDEIFPFFEIQVADDPRGLVAAIAGSDAGAKVRTGGVTADLYPSPTQVAGFIKSCADSGVPFKATAGMHHPLRHYSQIVKTEEFGFLNVFIAGALACCLDLPVDKVAACLVESDASAFSFSDAKIRWQGHTLTVEQLDDARETFAVSFGSCSFDEPREDLRGLRLL